MARWSDQPEVSRFFTYLIEDHLGVIDLADQEFRLLNRSAGALWLMLESGPMTVNALTAAFAQLFDVPAAQVADDVGRCLNEWRALGWIEAAGDTLVVRQAPPPVPATPPLSTDGSPPVEWCRRSYRVNQSVFSVVLGASQADARLLLDRVHAVLSGLPTVEERPGGPEISLIVEADRILVNGTGGPRAYGEPVRAYGALIRQVFMAAYPDQTMVAMVHAAAVGRSGGMLLMPGRSGVGKSTLAAYLVSRGWSYGGDDVIALAAGAGRDALQVLPLPAAISLKEPSWPVLGSRFPEIAALPLIRYADKTARYVPSQPYQTEPPAPADCGLVGLVFPQYVPDAPAALVPLSTADAIPALIDCGVSTGDRLEPDHLTRLFDFVAATRPFRLTFGSLEEAEAILATLCAPRPI